MEGLSLKSKMSRMRLNTNLKLLKSATIRKAEQIVVSKKYEVKKKNKVFLFFIISFLLILIIGLGYTFKLIPDLILN